KTGDISYLEVPKEEALEMGDPNALAVIPNEMALRPGDKVPIRTYPIDINGVRGEAVESEFESFIPPTARVKSTLDAGFEGNTLVVPTDADNSAGVFKATSNGLIGFTRGRIFEQLPMSEDF